MDEKISMDDGDLWRCSQCFIPNNSTETVCACCEAPRPGTVTESGPKFQFLTSNTASSIFIPCTAPNNEDVSMDSCGDPSDCTAKDGTNANKPNHETTCGFFPSVIKTTFPPTCAFFPSASNEMTERKGLFPSLSKDTPESKENEDNEGDNNSSSSSSFKDAETPTLGISGHEEAAVRVLPGTIDLLERSTDVYSWGTGECDQLAFSENDLDEDGAVTVPRCVQTFRSLFEDVPPKLYSPFEFKVPVREVACGALHSLAMVADGRVVSWGCNDDFALGRGGEERFPDFVENLPGSVCTIGCGDSHSACLTVEGKCLVWGSYKDNAGYIGFPDFSKGEGSIVSKKCKMPTIVSGLCGRCWMLAVGENHSVVLAGESYDHSEIYLWGSAEFGQLNCPPVDRTEIDEEQQRVAHLFPRKFTLESFLGGTVTEDTYVSAVYCGGGTTFLTTTTKNQDKENGGGEEKIENMERRVFGCGRNANGELGLGDEFSDDIIHSFKEIKKLRNVEIVKIVGGQFFTAALTPRGEVYTWGLAEFTCQGKHPIGTKLCSPTRLDTFSGAEGLYVGGNTGFITKKGVLYVWGEGQQYQLGLGEEFIDPVTSLHCVHPRYFNGKYVLRAAAGCQHSVAVVATEFFPPGLHGSIKRPVEMVPLAAPLPAKRRREDISEAVEKPKTRRRAREEVLFSAERQVKRRKTNHVEVEEVDEADEEENELSVVISPELTPVAKVGPSALLRRSARIVKKKEDHTSEKQAPVAAKKKVRGAAPEQGKKRNAALRGRTKKQISPPTSPSSSSVEEEEEEKEKGRTVRSTSRKKRSGSSDSSSSYSAAVVVPGSTMSSKLNTAAQRLAASKPKAKAKAKVKSKAKAKPKAKAKTVKRLKAEEEPSEGEKESSSTSSEEEENHMGVEVAKRRAVGKDTADKPDRKTPAGRALRSNSKPRAVASRRR